MAAATSPADPPADGAPDGPPGAASDRTAGDADSGTAPADPEPADARAGASGGRAVTGARAVVGAGPRAESGADVRTGPEADTAPGAGTGAQDAEQARGQEPEPADTGGSTLRPSRRFPLFTRDTARPEGGGRAAPSDAPAPARQWPLISVIVTAALGLLLVAADPFDQAFRVGAIVIGAALLGGALLRWTVPSVGMLAVRSRFTDLVTYGLMGALIVVFALMAQPGPWLDIPFLQDVARFTIR